MHVSKVTYQRKFNLGDYQHEEFSLELAPNEGDGFKEAHEALQKARKLFIANSTQHLLERAKKGAA